MPPLPRQHARPPSPAQGTLPPPEGVSDDLCPQPGAQTRGRGRQLVAMAVGSLAWGPEPKETAWDTQGHAGVAVSAERGLVQPSDGAEKIRDGVERSIWSIPAQKWGREEESPGRPPALGAG